jgi:hypothetical protein
MEEHATMTEVDAAGVGQTLTFVVAPEDAAFETSGHEAAVFTPRFGQAHQQYFSPKWLTEAFLQIALDCFHLRSGRTLTVIDPTCGSGRLLAPFAREGHKTLGVELDARLVPTARRVVGKQGYVLSGDIVQYAPLLADRAYNEIFNVVVTNPPYGLWWELPEEVKDSYELKSKSGQIESQATILDLAKQIGGIRDTLLLGLFSGRFFENTPRALEFLKRNFQVVALLTLPQPYKKEYGIGVDAAFVAAYRVNEHTEKKSIPLTGEWEGGVDADSLAGFVVEAYESLNPNPYHRPGESTPEINYLSGGWHVLPNIPRLDMAVEVDTEAAPVDLVRGVVPRSKWAGAWVKLLAHLPVTDFSVAEGGNADVIQAYGALPNVLIRGVPQTTGLLASVGFDAHVSEQSRQRIERMAARYEWERLPLRELHPAEYLAWYDDGEVVAQADAVIPGAGAEGKDVRVEANTSYTLRVRWQRISEVAQSEEIKSIDKKGKAKTGVKKTWIDRGYLVFRLRPSGGADDSPGLKAGASSDAFAVEEVKPEQVEAFIQAFPLPKVPTVAELPQYQSWAIQLDRLCDKVEARSGYRLYPKQFEDVSRLAVQRQIALLYEQGGGKTTSLFHWAAVRGYRRGLIVTVAGATPDNIIEDMCKWGFPITRLTHREISRIQAEKRAWREFWQVRRDSAARLTSLRRKLERLDQQMCANAPDAADTPPVLGGVDRIEDLQIAQELRDRLLAEAAELEQVLAGYQARRDVEQDIARKRRHLRNLCEIADKDKATNLEIDDEIGQAQAEIAELEAKLSKLPSPPDGGDETRFWICSYQDLGLGSGVYQTWEHDHYDRDTGSFSGTSKQNGTKCEWPGCRARRGQVVTECPECGAPWESKRGSDGGGARHCRKCGHIAWTRGKMMVRPPTAYRLRQGDSVGRLESKFGVTLDELRAANPRLAGTSARPGTPIIIPGKSIQGDHHTPMGPRVKHLFSVSIIDEAQDAKSRGTLAGENTRALHTKGRAIATGTLIAGYVTDLFWNLGWLVGQGHPLWPFPWRGGSARFLEQFGTYRWITKEFANTLEKGQRRLIPSVSNLGRLWRLISAFSLRRTKDELLDDLPEKHRELHWVELNEGHRGIYSDVEGWASDEIIKATHVGAGDSHAAAMGRIGRALWKTRYCASTATVNGWPFFFDVLGSGDEEGGGLAGTPAKVEKALELVQEIREAGEKAIVFSSLDGLHRDMAKALLDAGVGFYDLKTVGNTTSKRLAAVRRFERDPGATVLLSGTKMLNRGVTIVAANHVIILNLEWSPEPTVQAEDRVHRPGQERDVYIHYVLAAGTMEEDMYGLVMQKRDTQEAVMDRKAKDQSVQEILAEAVPMKKRLAEALVRNRSQRWEQVLQHRAETQAQATEKPVARKRPPSARRSHREEQENPWADWEALRKQVARQEVPKQRRTPSPADESLQPALFTF